MLGEELHHAFRVAPTLLLATESKTANAQASLSPPVLQPASTLQQSTAIMH